jgi:CRP/FNR family transcriptional regulator, dissimilatory nitrate respiration regulator
MSPSPNQLPAPLLELLPLNLQTQCIELHGIKGERLFDQSQAPEYMWFVAQGEVILQRLDTRGSNLVVQRVRQGWVAEASLQSTLYHCDAVFTASSKLVGISVQAVKRALLNDAKFAMRWVAMLNREVKRLRAQCERMSIKGVKDRLLHLLETEGVQGNLSLGTGLKSIAAELGVSHEALYRTVAELETAGILHRRDGQIGYRAVE